LSALGPKTPTINCLKLFKNAVLCLAIISSIACCTIAKAYCFSAAVVASASPGIRTLGISVLRNGTPLLSWRKTIDTFAGTAPQPLSVSVDVLKTVHLR
jgi:hypothetical protein